MLRYSFILFFYVGLFAQQTVGYTIQFIDAKDSVAIPFVSVAVDSAGFNKQQFAEAGIEGYVVLRQEQLRYATIVTANYPGYYSIVIPCSTLIAGDTLRVYLQPGPAQLQEIILVWYAEPVVETEPDHKGKRPHKTEPIVRKDTVAYTESELALFDSLKNGNYHIPDSLRSSGSIPFNEFGSLLKSQLHVTNGMIAHEENGAIYFEFDIDTNGFIRNIKCVHGACPLLAIQVAHVLAIMPRFVPPPGETQRFRLPVQIRKE